MNNDHFTILIRSSYYLIIGFILFYIFFGYQYFLHSDSAIINLLAQEAFETGKLFPDTWYFSNNDLYSTTFGYIFIIPLLYFFENTFFLHALSAFFSFVIFLLILHYFISSLKLNINNTLLGKILILAPFSIIRAEDIFGQQSYLWALIDIFVILTVLNNVFFLKKRHWLLFVLLIFAILHATISNPERSLFFFIVPSILSIITLHYTTICSQSFYSKIPYIGVFVLTFFFGFLINVWLTSDLNIVEVSNNIDLASIYRMLVNGFIFITGLLSYFGIISISSSGHYEFNGFIALLNLMCFITVIFSIVKIWKKRKLLTSSQIFVLIYGLILFLMTLFVYIVAFPLAINQWTMRYFTIALTIFSFTIVLYLQIQKKQTMKVIFILIILLTTTMNSYDQYVNKALTKEYTLKENPRAGLSEYLLKHNITYAYASFWNAQVVTLLSDLKVNVAAIDFTLDKPFHWLSSERWFRPVYFESTLILTQDEFNVYGRNFFDNCLGTPLEDDKFENYHIITYSKDIATCYKVK